MKIAIDFVSTNLGSGTKTYNINFCKEIQKIKKDDHEVTIEDDQEVANASSADDEAEKEVKADMESTEVDQELSDDTPSEDTNEKDK